MNFSRKTALDKKEVSIRTSIAAVASAAPVDLEEVPQILHIAESE